MASQNFSKRKIFLLLGVVLLSAGLSLALVSCYPGDDITASQSDIVATVFDPAADFSTKLTYARPPDVRVVSDPDQDIGDPTDLTVEMEKLILDSIDVGMAGAGFTVANPPVPPDPPDPTLTSPNVGDVHVLPVVMRTTWTGTGCSYYWDYWYGGYPPSYGWCYPYTYTFTTGTLVITMQVPNAPDQSQPIWVAAINGLLDNTTQAQLQQRVKNAIDQAFEQSPYLGAGK